MLKLLFIEDDEEAIEATLNLIKTEISDVHLCISGFEDADNRIKIMLPDIVILDIMDGYPPNDTPEGTNIYDFIWNNRFCPIIVYSAFPDRADEKKHPFKTIIKKGRDSDEKVLNAIKEFRPHTDALREAENHIRQQFANAMRNVAPHIFKIFDNDSKSVDVIKRAGRRRVAALMDQPLDDQKALATWEQYLFPPVSDDLQLGDVLRYKDGSPDGPEDFRIILTPSCDLVSSEGRSPKVSDVLVAKCCSMQEGLQQIGMTNPNCATIRKNSVITQGYSQNIIPFPELSGKIPTMAANLKDLELIPFENIKHLYCRVASVDSPFREMIAWAYLQTAGRPGLPDRDFDSWSKEIHKNTKVKN